LERGFTSAVTAPPNSVTDYLLSGPEGPEPALVYGSLVSTDGGCCVRHGGGGSRR
jgi:hypothetical protein